MSGRVVVITGASSGIGAELAQQLAAKGDQVVLIARRKTALDSVAERCSGRAHVIAGDVTRRADVRRAVAEAIDRFGHIDVWINNAGQGITRVPSELTDADIDEMVSVNIKSVLYGTQEVLPHFKSRGEGHVINISSLLGRVPVSIVRSAYSGAKHFVNALTAVFRSEVQQTHPGIQFSLVSPGVVRTEFGVNAIHGGVDSRILPDSQSVEEVAAVIATVVETKARDVYTRPGMHDRIVEYYASLSADADPPD